MAGGPDEAQREVNYRITLFGPFAVTTADGRDATPLGRKSKAIVALLALAPNGRRARRWLQDRLWSTVLDERGSASLRQELSTLRRHFAAFGPPIFDNMGDDVVLTTAGVWLDLRDGAPDPHRDLLEGIDVGDPEFEYWLSEERAYWYGRLDASTFTKAPPVAPKPRSRGLVPRLLVRPVCPNGEFEGLSVFAAHLTEELLASLHVLAGAVQIVAPANATSADFALEASVHALLGLRINARLVDLHDGTQLWSTRYQLADEPAPEEMERLSRGIVEAVQRFLSDGRWAGYWAGADVGTVAWELFQQGRVCEAAAQRSALIEAIGFYRAAACADPNFIQARISLAFCLVDGIRLCLLGAPAEALREARTIAQDTVKAAPDNLYGAALMAFVLCAEGRPRDAISIMEEVVTQMPRSPELVAYLAAVHGYSGDHEREQVLCRHALTLSAFPPIWIRTNLALSLILSDTDGAEDILRVVLDEQPRHPRALIAETVRLVRVGDILSARAIAARLRVADPDLRADRWRSKAFVASPDLHRRVTHDLKLAGLP